MARRGQARPVGVVQGLGWRKASGRSGERNEGRVLAPDDEDGRRCTIIRCEGEHGGVVVGLEAAPGCGARDA